jgi:hypothetical protein
MPQQISSYWDLVEPLFNRIDIDDPEKYFVSITGVPRPVLLLYAAHFCLAEVHNGGFLQFFWNSTGLIAPESIDGFGAIGMPRLCSIAKAASDLLGSPYPRDRNERWDALLKASGRSERHLKRIFKEAPNLFLAFHEATETLSFGDVNKEAWEAAETENGGFQEAATRYAQGLNSIQ